MRIATLGLCVMMGLGLAVGCDESASSNSAADAAKTAADKATAEANKATDAAKSAADSAADAAQAAGEKAEGAMEAAKEQGAAAVDAAKEAGGDMMAQAQKLFDDAKAAISKGDLDGAQKYVDQLKGWQDKLPPEWKAKVDEVVKMLADAKAKLGALPGMPK